ncbi:putative transposase for insertion sequence element ISRM3-like protein [Salmonella enterica subsp. enterica]|nr:putative transposase for insertion sequence element ISRM3-like protein [Salmonella enterica subsp. enterica]
MWLSGNEGTKFWLSVLTELKKRGLQDILIACVDGLKGFPDAINSVFPKYPQISKKLACALGKPQYALQLSAGYPQDHLPSTLQTQSNP